MKKVNLREHMSLGSRGNQAKFQIGNQVVKIDTYINGNRTGTEAMSEVLCSRLLRSASCHVEHVDYEFCKIQINDMVFSGCISNNFISEGASEYTLQEVYEKFNKKRKLDWVLSGKWPYRTPKKTVKSVYRSAYKQLFLSANARRTHQACALV